MTREVAFVILLLISMECSVCVAVILFVVC